MTCDYCTRGLRGVFNWHCRQCRARWYLAQPAKLHRAIGEIWDRNREADELADIRQHISERRVKVET